MPWIAAVVVVLLAAGAALVIILTNHSGGDDDPTAGPGPTTTAGGPLTRAYPSMRFSTDPADAAAQQEAQRSAESWVTAINEPDIDAAKEFMCERNQQFSEDELLQGIEVGSMEIGDVRVRDGKGEVPLTAQDTSGEEIGLSAPMVLESDTWKICLG